MRTVGDLMRVLLILFVLLNLSAVGEPSGQNDRETGKPSPTVGDRGPVLPRPPSVVWRRNMSQRSPQPLRESAEPGIPAIASPPRIAVSVPSFPFVSAPQPPPRLIRSRDQVLRAVAALRTGLTKAEVVANLGEPAYSIGIPEAGHYIERCRFRSGTENLVSIEFRDGYLSGIDRIAP